MVAPIERVAPKKQSICSAGIIGNHFSPRTTLVKSAERIIIPPLKSIEAKALNCNTSKKELLKDLMSSCFFEYAGKVTEEIIRVTSVAGRLAMRNATK
jgi:hypothetical protein